MKKLFISYSKSDREYLTTAKKHLKLLERTGRLTVWDDTMLIPGESWEDVIRRELTAADIILFLVSADLLATDFIWDIEMTEAMKRAAAGLVAVVPIIIHPCMWETAPFAKFAALPQKAKPVSTWDNEAEAWTHIVANIGKLC